MLDVRGVEAGYGKTTVLHDVSLVVGRGEIVGVLGRNGAGKSTLLKMLMGVLPARAGTVLLDREPIDGLGPAPRVARGMALVPQDDAVFPDLTVQENLEVSGLRLPRRRRRERKEQLAGLLPVLRERADSRARLLSGGERRALAIGIGLMLEPSLLLLDEPSAGLAPAAVATVMDWLQTLNREFGLSLLVVEQNVREALAVASRVYVTKNGSLVPVDDTPPFSLDRVVATL